MRRILLVCFGAVAVADPKVNVERNSADGSPIALWQAPQVQPAGILFLAHGCAHSALDFFRPSIDCPQCVGLPEEVHIVRAARGRGLVAVAVSAADTYHHCWREGDAERVRTVLDKVQAWARSLTGGRDLPVFALGASSGGSFVLLMPSWGFKLAGVCSQIMAVPARMLAAPFPPTVLVHMPRDPRTARAVEMLLQALQRLAPRVREIRALPLRIDDGFFAARIGGISAQRSAALARALKSAGLLDASGALASDPRRSRWRSAVRGLVPPAEDTLVSDASPISEELNVAYAMHEIVADQIDETLDFLQAGSIGARSERQFDR